MSGRYLNLVAESLLLWPIVGGENTYVCVTTANAGHEHCGRAPYLKSQKGHPHFKLSRTSLLVGPMIDRENTCHHCHESHKHCEISAILEVRKGHPPNVYVKLSNFVTNYRYLILSTH